MAQLKDSLITGDLRVTGTIYGLMSGNANTATKLATARKINGTNFDGTADITTTNWGTSRTVSIGSTAGTTGTSVNGSANVSLIVPSTMTGFASISSTSFVGALTGNASSATKLATPRALTIGSTGKDFDGSAAVSWTLAEIGAAAASHAHGNITNDGKVGTTADYAVVTTTGGKVTSTSLAVTSPTAATTTSTTFIDTVSQASNGKISATKKTLPSASTSVAGIVQLSSATNSTSTSLAATASAVKSAYDLANGAIPKSVGTAAGDIIYFSAASTPTRLAKGTNGQVLKINSSGVPAWSTDNNYITIRTWS